jgi:hypothetical protein
LPAGLFILVALEFGLVGRVLDSDHARRHAWVAIIQMAHNCVTNSASLRNRKPGSSRRLLLLKNKAGRKRPLGRCRALLWHVPSFADKAPVRRDQVAVCLDAKCVSAAGEEHCATGDAVRSVEPAEVLAGRYLLTITGEVLAAVLALKAAYVLDFRQKKTSMDVFRCCIWWAGGFVSKTI